jgi:hypothetical protein
MRDIFFFYIIRAYFLKICSVEFIKPVRPSVRPSLPYFFAIFQPTIFKFRILKGDNLRALDAAGNGSNLGFNYSQLEKQDKNSLTEVVT